MGNQILHLPVTLRTRRYLFLVYSVLGDNVSYWGTGPVLTRDPVYPTILINGLFNYRRGY